MTVFGAFSDVEKGDVDTDKLKKYKVFFATPCYGGLLTDQFFKSMLQTSQLFTQLGIPSVVVTMRNESLITRARNILTAMFLASDCTHLMFIDADIEFDPLSVVRALAFEKPILVGAYPKKTLPIQYAVNMKRGADGEPRREHSLVEVLDASTGFFLIQRAVLEKMVQEFPALQFKADFAIDDKCKPHLFALFDTSIDPIDQRYLSEDYTFCRRWQALGGEIWLDTATKLNHVGTYTFGA